MSISKLAATALLSVGLSISGAHASTVTNNFVFTDQGNSVVASGSFSYLSTATGTLGYSDLTAFTISLAGESYNLTFVNTLTPGFDYVYFGYDISTNSFVPASVLGFTSILAGTNLFEGFFFSPLASQGGANADGTFTEYRGPADGIAYALTISPDRVPTVPEPSTWIMMLFGFLGMVGLAYRRRENFSVGRSV
ncbi:PEPxxWA-CTERM sorting domain-containing protein [Bradyrhizobium sp. CB3481]|uniref:PEPxxWA-CTERM sorting domain-containing protein n=1 Tax=Bradyrhizobium sp. CB3481 TaxID=3039158 RepID=UPI0024B1543A|nr:PEPxxWA-CTERM sorting domain-containing protein [Bradyrhizobium sp. CB3481]WFU18774.1 PEPxxWA-CTERM sorting domain-containing protein [Bradyrhizobium sp. CB3481]